MQIDLDDAELDAVRTALNTTVRDLSPEIADTDNPDYRRSLKATRDLLASVLARLDTTA